ncbi:MAG TPA: hypothetical protein PLV68_03370, partial [Ilumatobacteraceae bacterium]|nr:hypothetical protein [Ilumatobacteraceae bacterium]
GPAGGGQPASGGSTVRIAMDDLAPANTTAVALNLTITDAAAAGYATAWSCDRSRPSTSTTNFGTGNVGAGSPTASFSFTAVGASRSVCVFVSATAHVVVDVFAAFVAGSGAERGLGWRAVGPVRVADTRAGAAAMAAGTVVEVAIPIDRGAGRSGAAVFVNLTVADAATGGYLTAWSCDQARPATSNVNYTGQRSSAGAGQVPIANAAVVSIGPSGRLCVFASSPAHVVVDLFGVFDAAGTGSFQPAVPTRILDTRDGTGGWAGSLMSARAIDVATALASGTTVVATVTATDVFGSGFVTASTGGVAGRPFVSNLNVVPGSTRPNLAVVALGPDASVRLSVGGNVATTMIVDVTGWFTPD